jgi:hypothetical protein
MEATKNNESSPAVTGSKSTVEAMLSGVVIGERPHDDDEKPVGRDDDNDDDNPVERDDDNDDDNPGERILIGYWLKEDTAFTTLVENLAR